MVSGHARQGDSGFTLVELLVALAVFAILSGIVYGALGSALKTRDQTEARNAARAQLMHAVMILERDLLQIVPRSVRNELGQQSAALVAERAPATRIELTRSGLPNPRHEKRSALQRVAYSLEGEKLVRRTWLVLDRTAQTFPLEETLLEGVSDFGFQALSSEWAETWPPLGSSEVSGSGPAQPLTLLPRAVRFTLVLDKDHELQRTIPVAGG